MSEYKNFKEKITIDAETIKRHLDDLHPAPEVYLYDRIDSTNSEAKRLFYGGNTSEKLLIAREQFGGRGRLGRSFFSPSDSGVYMTFSFTTDQELSDAILITVAASVAVLRSIKKNTGLDVGIKWVNDLYLHGKKVCGILAESVCSGKGNHIILGIGINLHTNHFPKEIADIAGSLHIPCDPNLLIADIVTELYRFLNNADLGGYLDDYRKHSIVLGKEVVCYRGSDKYEGIAEEITDRGVLVVRDKSGKVYQMDSGEITLRLS